MSGPLLSLQVVHRKPRSFFSGAIVFLVVPMRVILAVFVSRVLLKPRSFFGGAIVFLVASMRVILAVFVR